MKRRLFITLCALAVLAVLAVVYWLPGTSDPAHLTSLPTATDLEEGQLESSKAGDASDVVVEKAPAGARTTDAIAGYLRARLVDERGRPLRGVLVHGSAVPESELNPIPLNVDETHPRVGSCRSDVAGRIRLPLPVDRWLALETPPQEFVLADALCRIAPTSGDLDAGDLLCRKTRSTRGRVINAEGDGIADADVIAFYRDGLDYSHTHRRTEDDGSFTLDGHTEEPYQLQVFAAGYGEVAIRRPRADPEYRIGLTRARECKLEVTDDLGKPLEGARVTTVAVDEAVRHIASLEEAEKPGQFRIWVSGRGTRYRIRADGHEAITIRIARMMETCRIRLGRLGTVSGVVLRPDGTPHAGLAIECSTVGAPSQKSTARCTVVNTMESAQTTTDAQGRFTFRNVRPGRVRIHPRANLQLVTFDGEADRNESRELAAGAVIEGWRFESRERKFETRRIRVLDPTGRPVAAARIAHDQPLQFAQFAAVTTDSAGEALLRRSPRKEDELTITITSPDGLRAKRTIRWSEPDIEIRLLPRAGIEIKLEDVLSRPIAHGAVRAHHIRFEGGASKEELSVWRADSLGRIRHPAVESGRWRLQLLTRRPGSEAWSPWSALSLRVVARAVLTVNLREGQQESIVLMDPRRRTK